MADKLRISWWDKVLIGIAPDWGLRRVRARAQAQIAARHYDAATPGRRTSGWQRYSTDANTAAHAALTSLREFSRDLRRNNGWARRGFEVIANNSVGWGIMPKPKAGRSRKRNELAIEFWNDWADETTCDFDGRMNFYGLQRLAMETIAEAGEVLIVRQAPAGDESSIPLRLQVLEPDYLDASKHGLVTAEGNSIIGGVEFDKRGRRVAYWLFTSHPGSMGLMTTRFESVRVPADRVLHVYRVERPGQVRGVPWLASAIARLNDLDDFEDAELMRQKVAACFGAFVTDLEGQASALGGQDPDDELLEHLEPGHVAYLPPGKSVTFPQLPNVTDSAFSTRTLRRIAVSLGVPYEEMTGDYSQVNFSSARMSRLAHWQNVSVWREHMLIPQLCAGVWRWAMEVAGAMEGWPTAPLAQWSGPPMPVIEPDKEGLAYLRLVRIGAMTWQQMVRELGYDPTEQLREIAAFNKELDDLGIVLDIDPRKMTSAGQQQAPGAKALPAATTGTGTGEGDDEGGDDAPESKPAPPAGEATADESDAADAADAAGDDDDDEANDKTTPKAKAKPSAEAETKRFAYHQPFMKVKEIREDIGLDPNIEDAELFANEFVAKHSGKSAGDSGGDSGGGSSDA